VNSSIEFQPAAARRGPGGRAASGVPRAATTAQGFQNARVDRSWEKPDPGRSPNTEPSEQMTRPGRPRSPDVLAEGQAEGTQTAGAGPLNFFELFSKPPRRRWSAGGAPRTHRVPCLGRCECCGGVAKGLAHGAGQELVLENRARPVPFKKVEPGPWPFHGREPAGHTGKKNDGTTCKHRYPVCCPPERKTWRLPVGRAAGEEKTINR